MKLPAALLLSFLILSPFLHSTTFAKGDGDGFKTSKDGLNYKIIRDNKSGKKPALTNIIYLNLSYYLQGKPDSLLLDSRMTPQKKTVLQLTAPAYKGDIMEGLGMLKTGDSAVFVVSADSFFIKTAGMASLPPAIKKGSSLIFYVGLSEFKTMEELQVEQAHQDSITQSQSGMKKEEEMLHLQQYLKDNSITQAPRPSGLIIIPVVEGTGAKPQKGQKVSVHYTGYLLNGEKFDSSVDRGEPFVFTLGAGQVIQGWDEGVAEMKAGDSVKLIIPSTLGYGARGVGPIPPYSTLIFDVQFLKAE